MDIFTKYLKLLIFFMLFGAITSMFLGLMNVPHSAWFGATVALIAWAALTMKYRDFLFKAHGAYLPEKTELAAMREQVERIARRAAISSPQVLLSPSLAPNALAVSSTPYRATIILTRGLLNLLSTEEVEAVIAYEMAMITTPSHTVTVKLSVLGMLFSKFFDFSRMKKFLGVFPVPKKSDDHRSESRMANVIKVFFGFILFPFVSFLLNNSSEKSRIFGADLRAVNYCGDPSVLASALRKISAFGATATDTLMHPAFTPLYFVNPFTNKGVLDVMLIHPDIFERLEKILQLKKEPQI